MESKICTYSEPKNRLQLLLICDDDHSNQIFEIRYNRVLLKRDKDLQYMRYFFTNFVHMICINRESPLVKFNMLNT